MDSSHIAHEFGRQVKFEGAAVISATEDGTYDLKTGGRTFARTSTPKVSSAKVRQGDRAMILASSEHDQPMIVGWNPWISE